MTATLDSTSALAAWQAWSEMVLRERGLDPSKWNDRVRRIMIERALAAVEPEAPKTALADAWDEGAAEGIELAERGDTASQTQVDDFYKSNPYRSEQ